MSGIFTPEFISMLVGIVAAVLVSVVPQLEAVKTELITLLTVLVGLVIGGLGLERAAAARATGQTQVERQSLGASGAGRYVAPPVKSPPSP